MDQVVKKARENLCTILQTISMLKHWEKTRRNWVGRWAFWQRIELWIFRQ